MTRRSVAVRFRPLRRAAALLAAAAAIPIAGCGGGGGGTTDPASLPVFVDGAVVKGPVSGARVCGVWVVGGVADALTETCTTTGADGVYALQMPRRTGLLAVTATGGSFRDEATGATTALQALRSAAPFTGTGNNVVVQVTALTEVMVRRAQSRGALDESTVAAARTEVARTFGVSASTLVGERPGDPTARDANTAGTSQLLYGLSNAGVTGWMAERGITSLDQALGTLSALIGGAALYDELAPFRAGMRRVIDANPGSGLTQSASAWVSMVALSFGSPPPQPTRPPVIEQAGTQRFAVRWILSDLLALSNPIVCVTNVPASVTSDAVLAAMQAHAATYRTTVTSMTAVPQCLGAGQSMTLDWSQPSADPWGTQVWGDRG